MERPNKWVALGAIATVVIAITGILKFVLEIPLTIEVFILIALTVLAIIIITMCILFLDALSLIITAIKRIFIYLFAPFVEKRYADVLRTFSAVIVAIMVVHLFFITERLPTIVNIEETVKKVGNNIAAVNMASLGARMDNIIHAIINYQKDPKATRNRIYEDALKQAADKGFVFYIPQRDYYITQTNKRDDEYLLTKKERNRIKNSLDDIFKRSNERDQMNLMNMVLSDIRVIEELWMPKERLDTLSPIDLIGVVGGYIGELILKR
jgi:hypothetical protein